MFGSRYQTLENGDLTILNVDHNDQGKYTCKAQNKYGEVVESGELEIHKKTVIQVRFRKDSFAKVGKVPRPL